jgi:hypothetical protein
MPERKGPIMRRLFTGDIIAFGVEEDAIVKNERSKSKRLELCGEDELPDVPGQS